MWHHSPLQRIWKPEGIDSEEFYLMKNSRPIPESPPIVDVCTLCVRGLPDLPNAAPSLWSCLESLQTQYWALKLLLGLLLDACWGPRSFYVPMSQREMPYHLAIFGTGVAIALHPNLGCQVLVLNSHWQGHTVIAVSPNSSPNRGSDRSWPGNATSVLSTTLL